MIDAKLKEIILENVSDAGSYDIEGIDPETVDKAIPLIKQAFADEGWVEERLNNEPRHTVKLMTGSEWLERFEKELSNEIYGDTNPANKVDCEPVPYLCTCDLLEAAKKASNG